MVTESSRIPCKRSSSPRRENSRESCVAFPMLSTLPSYPSPNEQHLPQDHRPRLPSFARKSVFYLVSELMTSSANLKRSPLAKFERDRSSFTGSP